MVNFNTLPYKVPFILLFLLAIQACTPKVNTWAPSAIPVNEIELRTVNTDDGLVADMVTLAMRNSDLSTFQGQALSIYFPDFPADPQLGPFFFKWDEALVVVGRERNQINELLTSSYASMYSDVFFCQLMGQPYWNEVRIKEPEKISQEGSEILSTIGAEKGGLRIKLTPENLAASLGGFSTWEGVHLDTVQRELVMVGSSETNNPQISASDLVATYRAIFENEANGEAIFVDMDFKEGSDDYLVTFGGGLEDTRPGRVLYTSDLLLKALSSGIDPWIDEKPLVQSLCEFRRSPFQKVFCEYLSPFVHENRTDINNTISIAKEKYENGRQQVETIIYYGDILQRSYSRIWLYLFTAKEAELRSIINGVDSDGSFEVLGRSYHFGDSPSKYITEMELNRIADIPYHERQILREALRYTDFEQQIDYFTIAYSLPSTRRLLRSYDIGKARQLLDIIHELLRFEINDNLTPALIILHLIEAYPEFASGYLRLYRDDQIMLAILAYLMIDDRGHLNMIDRLQFSSPLCGAYKGERTEYIDFICRHLNKYEPNYLGDLIRERIDGAFEYKTVHELEGDYAESNENEFQKIRYWFFPANEVLTLKSEVDLNTFLFKKPQMEARSEILESRRGPYEAVNYDNPLPPAVQENLDIINTYYSELSDIFPSLKELNNVVRMLAFFRWVKYYHNDKFDLSAFAERNDYGTPTPRTYPLLETVIALQDGSLLRSVGGVDLHSRTQVSFDLEKMTAFEEAMATSRGNGNFEFAGKPFIWGLPVGAVASTAEQIVRSYSAGDRKIEIASQGAFYTVSHTNDGKLTWTVANDLDLYGDKRTIISNYQDGTATRSWWNAELESTVAWELVLKGGEIIAQRVAEETSAQNELDAIAITRDGLREMYANHLPFEAVKSYFFACFQDVKLTQKNAVILVQFKTKNSIHNWMVARDDSTAEVSITDVSDEMAQDFLTSPVQVSEKFERGVGVALSAAVSSDELITDDLGFRDDSLLKVTTYTKDLTKDYSIFDWRATVGIGDLKAMAGQSGEGKYILFPVLNEATKGQFKTYDLTNRAFLIEQVANLRSKMSSHKQYVAYSAMQPSAQGSGFDYAYQSVQERHFVFDTTGFAPNVQQELLSLHRQYPSQVSILQKNNQLSTPEVDGLEVVWVTTLTEGQITERIEAVAVEGNLCGITRLRIFNVNNPVYNLGRNVFQYCPNLSAVGGWTRIHNFMTVQTLIVKLLKTEFREIDQHTSAAVKAIQRDYMKNGNATPLRLRIARELDEVYYTWEELRPNSGRLRWIMARN